MSAARSLAAMPPPLPTRKVRTSLIDAEWDSIGSPHIPLVHTDTLKMRLPVLVLRNATADNEAAASRPRPVRSEPPRQLTNEGTLAPQASEASQTLKSVPPPPRSWSVFQLGILAATTLVGFVVGYGVLFATAISSEGRPERGAVLEQSVVVPPSSPVIAAPEPSTRVPDAEAALVPTPANTLKVASSKLPKARATPKASTKDARSLRWQAPKAPKRANPASDNPY